ncbi:hypothetical protein IKG45_01770 [Candidatus Saccharibacteria bacterium]|nr:hypothetical protein [Candidatus Saccharibacteria bacterium]
MKKRKTRYSVFVFVALSAICLLISFSDIPDSFARYLISFSGGMTSDVAKPILVVDVTSPSDTLDPENSIDIDFDVKNYENNSISEVGLEYYLSFANTGSTPLTFSLKNNSSNETIPLDSNNKTTVAASVPITQTAHPYTLTVSWDSSGDKSSALANITDSLVITATVKQSFRSSP